MPYVASKRKYTKTPAPLVVPTQESILARGSGSSTIPNATPITSTYALGNFPPRSDTRQYSLTPAPLPVPTLESIRAAGSSLSSIPLPSPPAPPPPSASTLKPLRAPRRTRFQKIDDVLKTWAFRSLGDFLSALFHPRVRGNDPRTKRHRQVVGAFLQGHTNTAMGDIIQLIYNHHKSRPKESNTADRSAAFSPSKSLKKIRCAAPCLSAWATGLVGAHAHRRVGKMARKPQAGGRSRRHLRASTNGRNERAEVVEWEDIEFTIDGLADQYKEEDEFLWFLTECMAGTRKDGQFVAKKTRPHPVIQVGAISSFITARNQQASGDLALPLGLWLFVCQAHIDIKRVLCRFGYSVSDSTARRALDTVTDSDLARLRADVQAATAQQEVIVGKVTDNIQRYDAVYEHGIGRVSELKVGTACTMFYFDDCKPGAFRAADHIERVIRQERQTMTTESVWNSIDWDHMDSVTELHFVRVLVAFIPQLNHLSTQVSTRFRTTLAIRRLHPHKKKLQPVGTNGDRQVENKGYQAGNLDFDQQGGVEPEKSDNLLSWNRGDGAAHATHMRLQRILATTPNIYKSYRNALSTPEIWHTKSTDLNSCAGNHYGPSASPDPSSLSRSSNATNMKRPTDLKKCDFYPTSRAMTLMWEAQVLDCWRLILECDGDLLEHFDELAASDALPTLEDLLEHATTLRARYASHAAYERSLDKSEHDDTPSSWKTPDGSPWTAPCAPETPIPDTDKSAADGEGPKTHTELPGFDGDRVLGNSILFLMEFGWWVEMNYAIPEGDVGRLFEILKIFIFTFAGTANQNYMGYMLDLYALLHFECSDDLRDALLNNYLFNLEGKAGEFVEGDLIQEWFNRWLEDIAGRRGGEFDENFYRRTVAPNVFRFLKMIKGIESAFQLKRRGKAHTSPHLRDETKILLKLYKDEELHSFRSGRSLGHAAINRFDRGYQRLDESKMDEFLARSAEYANILTEMEVIRNEGQTDDAPIISPRGSSPDVPPHPQSPSPTPSSTPSGRSSSTSLTSRSDSHSSRSLRSPTISQRGIDASDSPGAARARLAANSVQEWDHMDHSDEPRLSGSDLTVTVDPETGRMSDDWYEPEEFELLLERMCGPELLGGEADDDSEEESEPEDEETESEGEGESDSAREGDSDSVQEGDSDSECDDSD
ncbi:hypothetical protein C8R46DRAFT_910243 [Mycena filopes]|nr:hypothetical protein C8R46DRAFT_910243 [Mycena filopes]